MLRWCNVLSTRISAGQRSICQHRFRVRFTCSILAQQLRACWHPQLCKLPSGANGSLLAECAQTERPMLLLLPAICRRERQRAATRITIARLLLAALLAGMT